MGTKITALVLIAFAWLGPSDAHAGARDQAYRLYSRLTGVPPTDAELTQMESLISQGKVKDAARVATQSFFFVNSNLVRFAKPWSNQGRSPRPENGEDSRVPLNDFVATVVGMVRDDVPFDQVLYGDILYKGVDGLANVTPFSLENNDHYRDIGSRVAPFAGGLDLRDRGTLVSASQVALHATAVDNQVTDVAGVLTSRQSGLAFFSAGTNRRPTRYAFINFLCHDMEEVSDATVADIRIRRDVDRAPTGDSKIFLTTCKGCHAGMDGLSGAWARFNFGSRLEYTAGVQGKMNQNAVFAGGYVTNNDGWVNLWSTGPNTKLGWRATPSSGNGANALGRVLAGTRAFSVCMAKRAFRFVCLRESFADEESTIAALADRFEANNGFNMRNLIEDAAVLPQCLGI